MSRLGAVASLALLAAACGDDAAERAGLAVEMPPAGFPAPAALDRGAHCADVADTRACWDADGEGAGCREGVCRVPRPLPGGAPAVDGLRCGGGGEERRCVPRRGGAGAFRCEEGRCLQRYPRLPDASFWECIDDDGVVVCRGGEPAAGVAPATSDLGWLCAARRGGEVGERVCVDASPDVPRPPAHAWRCRYEHNPVEQRRCDEDVGTPRVGSTCTADGDCPRAAVCAGERCLPRVLSPACWLDADCGDGAWCRFGSCIPEDA